MDVFSEQLRYLRECAGMTQIELAKAIGVAPTTYRNYENTSREPNFDTLIKIASVLNVSVDELLGVSHTNSTLNKLKTSINYLPPETYPGLLDFIGYLSYKYRKDKGIKK